MDNIFEKRKQQLLDELAIKYAPTRNIFKAGWLPEYTSTERYTLHGPFDREVVEIKRSVSFFIICILFSVGWISVAFGAIKGWPGLIFSIPGIGILIYSLIYIFDRKVQMRLDDIGIWHHESNVLIPWELVGPTYIKREPRGKISVHFLLVYHFNITIQDFECTEMEFEFLGISVAKIAAQVEYFKKQASNRQ